MKHCTRLRLSCIDRNYLEQRNYLEHCQYTRIGNFLLFPLGQSLFVDIWVVVQVVDQFLGKNTQSNKSSTRRVYAIPAQTGQKENRLLGGTGGSSQATNLISSSTHFPTNTRENRGQGTIWTQSKAFLWSCGIPHVTTFTRLYPKLIGSACPLRRQKIARTNQCNKVKTDHKLMTQWTC